MADPKNPSKSRANVTRHGWASPGKFSGWNDEPTEVRPPRAPAPAVEPPIVVGAPAVAASPARAPVAMPAHPAPAPAAPQAPAERPPIEVVVVTERRSVNTDPGPWRAVEIWTRNRIYGLDAQLICIEVIDRATGRREAAHSLLGARLGGGQRRDGDGLALSHPFPVPGTDAVFKHTSKRNGHYGQTSKVERVVMRVRVTQVALVDAEPAWEEITGQHDRLRLQNNNGG